MLISLRIVNITFISNICSLSLYYLKLMEEKKHKSKVLFSKGSQDTNRLKEQVAPMKSSVDRIKISNIKKLIKEV